MFTTIEIQSQVKNTHEGEVFFVIGMILCELFQNVNMRSVKILPVLSPPHIQNFDVTMTWV